MKMFILKVFYFGLSLLLFLSVPIISLYKSGEFFYNFNNLLTENNYLVGLKFNEDNFEFYKKHHIQNSNRVDILAMGSSRIMQLRQEMFNTSFYNAGLTVSTFNSVKDFSVLFKSIPKEKYPKLIVMNLDPWVFNSNLKVVSNQKEIKNNNFWPSFAQLKKVYKEIVFSKSENCFERIEGEKLIGYNALQNHAGFRNDGSMCYGLVIDRIIKKKSNIPDFQFKNTLRDIKNGRTLFSYGDSINKASLEDLVDFLSFCSENEIDVIGMFAPMTNLGYKALTSRGNHTYIKKVFPATKVVFDQFHFELFNFLDPKTCDLNDDEALDGFHMGEVAYAKLLLKMKSQNSKLSQYLAADLAEKVADSENRIELFGSE